MPQPHLQKLSGLLCKGACLWRAGERGRKDSGLGNRKDCRQKSFSDQRSDASHTANLAPAESTLGHPPADLGRMEEFSTISLWNPTRESKLTESRRQSTGSATERAGYEASEKTTQWTPISPDILVCKQRDLGGLEGWTGHWALWKNSYTLPKAKGQKNQPWDLLWLLSQSSKVQD